MEHRAGECAAQSGCWALQQTERAAIGEGTVESAPDEPADSPKIYTSMPKGHKTAREDEAAAAVPSPKRLKAMFADASDELLLAEVERRNLTEHVRHAAVEAAVKANYTVGTVLGEGSSAKVYAATHNSTGEDFAIKWIDKNGDMNDDASMAAELAILKRLHHKNIVNLHEVFESETTLWLIMEKVGGGELLGYLEELNHLSEAYVRDIAKQLCTGLHYIHSAGVVHRDIKLENVLRATSSPDSCVKIADFGLAAILPRFEKHNFDVDASVKRKSSKNLKDMWGTPQYFSPELIDEAYGTQVDVWSLGCVLYELLSGHKLFGESIANIENIWDDENAETALYAEIKAGPSSAAFSSEKWDAGISTECKGFLLALCNVDPVQRLSAGEALKHSWMSDKVGSKAATHHIAAAHGKLRKAVAKKAPGKAKKKAK